MMPGLSDRHSGAPESASVSVRGPALRSIGVGHLLMVRLALPGFQTVSSLTHVRELVPHVTLSMPIASVCPIWQ